MDGWDIALVAAAGYVATTSLVRLMIRHRDQRLGEFRQRMAAEKRRKARAEKQQSAPPREAA